MVTRGSWWKRGLALVALWGLGGCGPKVGETLPSFADLEAAANRPLEVAPWPAATTWVLRGASVWTADGTQYVPGRVVMADGRIVSVGPDEGPVPEGEVVDLTGHWITPGLIDTHSHLGVYPSPHLRAHSDGNEAVGPTTAGAWAEGGAWPQDPGFQRAVAGGITTLQLLPGSANLIGGRGVVMRPVPARGSRAMRFEGAPPTVKMACGENPKRVYSDRGGPQTRMGNVRGFRERFIQAQAWLEETKDGVAPKARDVDLETLGLVLQGDALVQVHCYRADDMLGMMQIADEFGWRIRGFHHAIEAYKIRDLLADHDISVSTWADWWGFKAEAWDMVLANAAMVTDAGARAVIHSDDAIGIQRLNQEAGKAFTEGRRAGFDVSEDDAIRWVTANAAWTLGIDDETGRIAEGLRGDVVVWDGHPFSVYASARLVFIDGRLVWDVDRPTAWSDLEAGLEVVR